MRVRVLAAGVSYTDAMLRAGSYLGVPKPPFTPGYELVGVVDELGPGCTRLCVGDRVGALTVWGADAERVCVLEANAVEVPEDVDPAQILSLVFTHMTAYQLLHRTARVKSGETVLVHGAAGRVGTAVLELGAVAGLRMYGTCSARDGAAVERLGGVAIDYRNDDFLARVRELHGRKSWRGWIKWYARSPRPALTPEARRPAPRSEPSRRGTADGPQLTRATPSAASSASDGACGRRTTFTGPRTSEVKRRSASGSHRVIGYTQSTPASR